jgi:hypothetical protein
MIATGTEYIVIRHVATDELRINRIQRGYRPPSDPAYTWGGPFRTNKAAKKAVASKDESLRAQLYPLAEVKGGAS